MNVTAQKKIVPNKVLVTGASGLLEAAAIEKLLSAGWEVVGVSRRKSVSSSRVLLRYRAAAVRRHGERSSSPTPDDP
jgi:NAD(P)-dependent dehydrogenase (short-subunit alcohol dehydrogenase family)